MADESVLTETPAEGTSIVTEEEKVEDTAAPVEDAAEAVNEEDAKEGEEEEVVEYDFTFPEDVTVDEDLIGKFKSVAASLKLSKEGAQQLVDLQLEAQKSQLEAWDKQVTEWRQSAETDKEIGGKAFKENVATARKALKQFGTDDLTKALDAYGMGNHPEFIRFLYRVGKNMSEDKILVGGNPKGEARDAARTIFPSMAN